ncbi:MAG: hypothetical protein WCV58_03360 [Patescibacteria group bacterium]|jgi:3-hydroxyacyl-[acyl-carrier-protein] dehydratase
MPNQTVAQETLKIALPHGSGFRLLSRVNEITENTVKAEFDYTGKEKLDLSDHFPGHPIFPGGLLLESMAEAAIQLAQNNPNFQDKLFVLKDIESCSFRQQITPGSTITFSIKLMEYRHHLGKVFCLAQANDQDVADAIISFFVIDDENKKYHKQIEVMLNNAIRFHEGDFNLHQVDTISTIRHRLMSEPNLFNESTAKAVDRLLLQVGLNSIPSGE